MHGCERGQLCLHIPCLCWPTHWSLLSQPAGPAWPCVRQGTSKPRFQDLPPRILSPCRRDSGGQPEGKREEQSIWQEEAQRSAE